MICLGLLVFALVPGRNASEDSRLHAQSAEQPYIEAALGTPRVVGSVLPSAFVTATLQSPLGGEPIRAHAQADEHGNFEVWFETWVFTHWEYRLLGEGDMLSVDYSGGESINGTLPPLDLGIDVASGVITGTTLADQALELEVWANDEVIESRSLRAVADGSCTATVELPDMPLTRPDVVHHGLIRLEMWNKIRVSRPWSAHVIETRTGMSFIVSRGAPFEPMSVVVHGPSGRVVARAEMMGALHSSSGLNSINGGEYIPQPGDRLTVTRHSSTVEVTVPVLAGVIDGTWIHGAGPPGAVIMLYRNEWPDFESVKAVRVGANGEFDWQYPGPIEDLDRGFGAELIVPGHVHSTVIAPVSVQVDYYLRTIEGTAPPGSDVEVRLEDPGGGRDSTVGVRTDRQGVFAASFEQPIDGPGRIAYIDIDSGFAQLELRIVLPELSIHPLPDALQVIGRSSGLTRPRLRYEETTYDVTIGRRNFPRVESMTVDATGAYTATTNREYLQPGMRLFRTWRQVTADLSRVCAPAASM